MTMAENHDGIVQMAYMNDAVVLLPESGGVCWDTFGEFSPDDYCTKNGI